MIKATTPSADPSQPAPSADLLTALFAPGAPAQAQDFLAFLAKHSSQTVERSETLVEIPHVEKQASSAQIASDQPLNMQNLPEADGQLLALPANFAAQRALVELGEEVSALLDPDFLPTKLGQGEVFEHPVEAAVSAMPLTLAIEPRQTEQASGDIGAVAVEVVDVKFSPVVVEDVDVKSGAAMAADRDASSNENEETVLVPVDNVFEVETTTASIVPSPIFLTSSPSGVDGDKKSIQPPTFFEAINPAPTRDVSLSAPSVISGVVPADIKAPKAQVAAASSTPEPLPTPVSQPQLPVKDYSNVSAFANDAQVVGLVSDGSVTERTFGAPSAHVSAPSTPPASTVIQNPLVASLGDSSSISRAPIEPHLMRLDGGPVQVEVLKLVRQGGGQIVLELTPPDQGTYRIDLRLDLAGRAQLVIEGASDSVRTRLEQGESGLKDQFAQLGLDLQLNFRQSGQGESLAQAQEQEQDGGNNLVGSSSELRSASDSRTARNSVGADQALVHLYA